MGLFDGIDVGLRRLLGSTKPGSQTDTVRKAQLNLPNKVFCQNTIVNTKFTPITFLPIMLYQQFSTPMNLYFLAIAFLQLWPAISVVNPITTWAPLLLVFSVTCLKEATDDMKRRKADSIANQRPYTIWRSGEKLTNFPAAKILVGDLIELKDDDEIPCDVVVLKTSGAAAEGVVYLETANLDGETDLKRRAVVKPTSSLSWESLPKLSATLVCDPPNMNLYRFDANLSLNNVSSANNNGSDEYVIIDRENESFRETEPLFVPLSDENLLQHGTIIRRTGVAVGVAIYTGADTKLSQNKSKTPRKVSAVDYRINQFVVAVFTFQIILIISLGLLGYAWKGNNNRDYWYLEWPRIVSLEKGLRKPSSVLGDEALPYKPVNERDFPALPNFLTNVNDEIEAKTPARFLSYSDFFNMTLRDSLQQGLLRLSEYIGKAMNGSSVEDFSMQYHLNHSHYEMNSYYYPDDSNSSFSFLMNLTGGNYSGEALVSLIQIGVSSIFDIFTKGTTLMFEIMSNESLSLSFMSTGSASVLSTNSSVNPYFFGAGTSESVESSFERYLTAFSENTAVPSPDGISLAILPGDTGLDSTPSNNATVLLPWYFNWILPLRFLLLCSMMIPISLKVSLDVVKVLYGFFIAKDLLLYDPATDTPAVVNNTNVLEDLGLVDVVLTDKTGTLTDNVMTLYAASIAGCVYSANSGAALSPGNLRVPEFSSAPEVPQITSTEDSMGIPNIAKDLQLRLEMQQGQPHAADFFLALALCNTVAPEAVLAVPVSQAEQQWALTTPEGRRRRISSSASDEIEEVGLIQGGRTRATSAFGMKLIATAAQENGSSSYQPHTPGSASRTLSSVSDTAPLSASGRPSSTDIGKPQLVQFAASSPDEEALVLGAAKLGVVLSHRRPLQLTDLSISGTNPSSAAPGLNMSINAAANVVGHRHTLPTLGTVAPSSGSSGEDGEDIPLPLFQSMVALGAERLTVRFGNPTSLSAGSVSSSGLVEGPKHVWTSDLLPAAQFDVFCVIPFDSDRKRMSIICRSLAFGGNSASLNSNVGVMKNLNEAHGSQGDYRYINTAAAGVNGFIHRFEYFMITKGADEVVSPLLHSSIHSPNSDYFSLFSNALSPSSSNSSGFIHKTGGGTFSSTNRSEKYIDWLRGTSGAPAYRDIHSHLEAFASEGLRTLMVAWRPLSRSEVLRTLTDVKHAASETSSQARTALFTRVAASVENGLFLLGASAIEDRLQQGVPAAIAGLRKAGISVWMLTGDKKGTALQIALASNLIDHLKSPGTNGLVPSPPQPHLHGGGTGSGEEKASEAPGVTTSLSGIGSRRSFVMGNTTIWNLECGSIDECQTELEHFLGLIKRFEAQYLSLESSSTPHISGTPSKGSKNLKESQRAIHFKRPVLVVDGLTLRHVFASEALTARLAVLAEFCESVIACRCTPSQKANLVKCACARGMRTLAIGDGGNDVAMLQCADVGVGISGNEGLQAARSADVSVARFRLLLPLLVIHGRFAHRRTALVSLYTFYKSMAVSVLQVLGNSVCQFSGCSLLDTYSLTSYNLVYTFLPSLLLCLDVDVLPMRLLREPALFRESRRHSWLSPTAFAMWTFRAIYHGFLVFLFVLLRENNDVWGAFWDCSSSGLDWNSAGLVAFAGLIAIQFFTLLSTMRRISFVNLLVIASFSIIFLLILAYRELVANLFNRGAVGIIREGLGLHFPLLVLIIGTCATIPFVFQRHWSIYFGSSGAYRSISHGNASVYRSRSKSFPEIVRNLNFCYLVEKISYYYRISMDSVGFGDAARAGKRHRKGSENMSPDPKKGTPMTHSIHGENDRSGEEIDISSGNPLLESSLLISRSSHNHDDSNSGGLRDTIARSLNFTSFSHTKGPILPASYSKTSRPQDSSKNH